MRKSLTLVFGTALLAVNWCVSVSQGAPEDETTGAELKRLERLVADSKADPAQIWDGLIALRQHSPGSRDAIRAGQLLFQACSPLDGLDPRRIPPIERSDYQPRELSSGAGGTSCP